MHLRDVNDSGYRFLCDNATDECARITALIAANPNMRAIAVNVSGGAQTLTFDAPLARCFVGKLTPTVISGTVSMQRNGMLAMDVTDARPAD